MSIVLPIAVILPMFGAVIGKCISDALSKIRDGYFILITVLELILTGSLLFHTDGAVTFELPSVVGLGLSFQGDHFRVLYAVVASFLWLMTMIFAMEYLGHDMERKRYCFYNLLTLTGVIGVFLSNDLFTTFVFFEIMSFASYPLVIHEETEEAMKAGTTYLTVAVISGMALLVGVFFLQNEANTLTFEGLRAYFSSINISGLGFAGGILVLLGFGAKAGMYPLHIWLPQAHPVAPSPASALLSGILTKTGVFGIIVLVADVFPRNELFGLILLTLGVITMFLGALLALFSVNLKRTLACSSMSQIGFILVGLSFMELLGAEGGLAQNGALLHMMNHSLIKLVLFMCAGVIAMNIHALDLNEIRGYGRKKPFLCVIFLVGSLGIMGVPFFNGYASKTMIHESIVEYINEVNLSALSMGLVKGVEWIFLISGGLTVAYMTKLLVCIFIEKNEDETRQKQFDQPNKYMSLPSKIVFGISAIPLVIIGILPNEIVERVTSPAYEFFGVERFDHSVAFFGLESLKGGAISLGIGFLVYFLIVRTVFIKNGVYRSLWPQKLDLEYCFYRPILVSGNLLFIRFIVSPIASSFEWLVINGTLFFIKTVVRFFAIAFDGCIVLLSHTILRARVYQYREETFSMKIGELIDRFTSKNEKHRYAKKMDSVTETIGKVVSTEYASFSFAFAMISLGVIIVLLFAIFG